MTVVVSDNFKFNTSIKGAANRNCYKDLTRLMYIYPDENLKNKTNLALTLSATRELLLGNLGCSYKHGCAGSAFKLFRPVARFFPPRRVK